MFQKTEPIVTSLAAAAAVPAEKMTMASRGTRPVQIIEAVILSLSVDRSEIEAEECAAINAQALQRVLANDANFFSTDRW